MRILEERCNEPSNPYLTKTCQWQIQTWICGRWLRYLYGPPCGVEATCYWSTLTLHLRTLQEAAVQQVTKQRDIDFIAVNLFIFTSWADTGFPWDFPPQQPARRIGMSEVLEGWQKHNQRILNRSLASRRSKWFLHSPSAASGVFGLHLDKNTASFHGTPRSGKQRVIDNGDTGGQSERSSDANKLTLCSPLRPAQHISLVMHRWSEDEMRSTHFVFILSSGRLGDRPGRPTIRLLLLSHVHAGKPGLRSSTGPWWMANPSVPTVLRPTFWPPVGGDIIQQIL